MLALAHLNDRDLDEVADDLLDVAADIADFGELVASTSMKGVLASFASRRAIGLADAGRPDHQDVFGSTSREGFRWTAAAATVARSDRYRALGIGLAADEADSSGTISRGEKSVICIVSWESGRPIEWFDDATRAAWGRYWVSAADDVRIPARATSSQRSATERMWPSADIVCGALYLK